ncbi:MAG: beta-phosphoglucomutase [Lachnospiraceae bacterium]|nr:beta-phosphoglucomutase [Lachnospiraceae bacterium]GFI04156.1 beta-phosphoglucomutase [Lachnospiraceae bacterium]
MKGIIFDLDGVIISTDKLHYKAWKKIADKLNIAFDEKINNRLRGVSRMDSLEIILEGYQGPALNKEEKEALADEKNACYVELLGTLHPDQMNPDVTDTLRYLREKGLKLAIGSSSKNTKYILHQLEIENLFDAVSDGTNITKSKPDPEVFIKAASFLELPEEECIVVEDAVAGIDAARSGHMRSVGIGDAYFYNQADYHIKTFSELKNLF